MYLLFYVAMQRGVHSLPFDVITQKGALSPSIPTDSVILGVTNAYYLSQNGAPPKEGLKWVGGTPKMKWVGGTRSISRWRPPGVLRYLQSLIPGTTDFVRLGETNAFLLQSPCPDPLGVRRNYTAEQHVFGILSVWLRIAPSR